MKQFTMLFVTALLASASLAAEPVMRATPDCDRACLYGVLDQYLAGLKARDTRKVPWAAQVKNTENNVELRLGDGLWGTITALDRLRDALCRPADRGSGHLRRGAGNHRAFTLRHAPQGGEQDHHRGGNHRRSPLGCRHSLRHRRHQAPAGVGRDPHPCPALTAPEDDRPGRWLFRHAAAQRRHPAHGIRGRLQPARGRHAVDQQRAGGAGSDLEMGLRGPVPARAVPL